MDVLIKKWDVLDRRISFIDTSLANNINQALDQAELKTHLKNLESYIKSAEDIYYGVLDHQPKDEPKYTSAFCVQEKKINDLTTTATRLLDALIKKEANKNKGAPPPPPDTHVKLPTIPLATFDGKFEDWTSFRDLFKASVLDSASLTDALKLQYLKSAVKGEAARLISSYQITDANFAHAWQTLEDRYANDREIVNAHLKRLFGQPAVTQESASQLQLLLDTTNECTRALAVLKRPVQHWDDLLIYMTVDKMDAETRREWAMSLKDKKPATFKQLEEFIEQRVRGLQASTSNANDHSHKSSSFPGASDRRPAASHQTGMDRCTFCKGQHLIFSCESFKSLSVQDRLTKVKSSSLCVNCLRPHAFRDCKSQKTCHNCNQRHHTLLHLDKRPATATASTHKGESSTKEVKSLVSSAREPIPAQVLLSTVLVKVADQAGTKRVCRALLDGGSEATFITENCVRSLGLKRSRDSTHISGISSTKSGMSHGRVTLQLSSCINQSAVAAEAYILPKITSDLPKFTFSHSPWQHIEGLQLADPSYSVSAPIDILIGADILASILKDGRIVGPNNTPVALNSMFGWYLSGKVVTDNTKSIRVHHVNCESDAILKRFWELEELPPTKHLTAEEKAAELHFTETHQRDETGRYVVRFPFRDNIKSLGSSRAQAISRLHQVERRLAKLPERQQQYHQVMQEYLDLGHMELVKEAEINNKSYYIPHLFVTKEASSTTKLRVVYDASAKTSTGLSLNDCIIDSPTIQDDLFTILIRFRWNVIALKADIVKMYRQFQVHPDDRDYQRIVWRDSPTAPIRDYRHTRVTFGTKPGAFLATRCLQQLSIDEQVNFPEAGRVLERDIYVDDLLSGAAGADQAMELKNQLCGIVKTAGMELRKWATNDSAVLATISLEDRETEGELSFDTDTTIKALGIQWKPAADIFIFTVNPSTPVKITKRIMLSELAKVFDPLGWLSPVTIRAKIMFQDLWRATLGWDQQLSNNISEEWKSYQRDLHQIKKIQIPRCVVLPNSTTQIHGFCDASLKAYVAVLYIRSETPDGAVNTRLLAAKTKVAPIKIVSLPKLELCGAVLLTKLLEIVIAALKFNGEVYAWTDSTIVLQWLSAFPGRWNTFVANRVAQIQELMPTERWHHVISEENPADCPTRGKSAAELRSLDLWWHGPHWLKDPTFPITPAPRTHDPNELEERRATLRSAHVCVDESLLAKYSDLTRLKRITAYCLRFIHNMKSNEKKGGELTPDELHQALLHWIHVAQESEFPKEIHALKNGKAIPINTKLSSLTPFLDNLGTLRVGGRLQKSQLPESIKHQIILPSTHKLTELIIRQQHLVHLHAGFQLLWTTLNRHFWILRARSTIRHLVRKCVKCRKYRAETTQQLMGSLPAARVTPGRVFQSCGVDYAGPFNLRLMYGRNNKTFKGYFAIFVCMATKAIHLEAVSDLSTEAFVAAFKRFIGRRAAPSHMFSDCGTNFVGADKELQKLLESAQHNDRVSHNLADQGILWHFNPPSSPHHGGLWEAGVKSVKFHLRRVIGDTRLTFEDFQTILCQVEACVNSRPICAMSSDPNDLNALTPGHFLVGQPLTAIPEPDLTEVKINRLNKWQLTQQFTQHFWQRWSAEYLTTLQQRYKWKSPRPNLQIGDLVVIKEDNIPLTKWQLGRIIDVHPGDDANIRVATVKTQTGQYKRPIVKLCPILRKDE